MNVHYQHRQIGWVMLVMGGLPPARFNRVRNLSRPARIAAARHHPILGCSALGSISRFLLLDDG